MSTTTNKPGWQTSEFWVATVPTLLLTLNQSGLLGSIVIPIEAVMAIVAPLAAYIGGRSYKKGKEVEGS